MKKNIHIEWDFYPLRERVFIMKTLSTNFNYLNKSGDWNSNQIIFGNLRKQNT